MGGGSIKGIGGPMKVRLTRAALEFIIGFPFMAQGFEAFRAQT